MSKKPISTLFELLGTYKVEVPIVQRDYAHGRQDDHTTNVRYSLLNDMHKAILRESPPLDLSFVYGKSKDNNIFVPIDGQQRLTTLFLLYLYAFRNDETKTTFLNQFTYETRITSRVFFEALIKHRESVFTSETTPSEEIEDSEWFASSWRRDPTIKSALVVLNDIQKIFSDVDDLEHKLENQADNPITFKFLNMNDLGMEDSLYIKLNARGKPLTELENFKALLIRRMAQLKISYIDQFELNFDCIWTDLFWEKNKEDFDATYYAFFGVLLMNLGIIQDDKNWANAIDYDKIDADIFATIFYTLNFLCENPGDTEANSLIFNALPEKERTYPKRVLFHAVTTYLSLTKAVDNGKLKQWLRIIKNLSLNSQIDEAERYKNAIDGINALKEHRDNLLSFFANENKVSGFNLEQTREEQIKAKIILSNEDFAENIYKAEQHSYFSGQIRSALYLAKKSTGVDGHEYDKVLFERYWEKISKLFDDKKPKEENVLRRALLTLGDYTLPVSHYKTLCVNDPDEAASTPSLKSLFSKCGDITQKLLDALDINRPFKEQMENMIQKSIVPGNDWRYCFIQYPELFEHMSVSHLRLYVLQNVMKIIRKKAANGYNYDLFLLALLEELENRGIQSEHNYELGSGAKHSLSSKGYTISFGSGQFSGQFSATVTATQEIAFETKTDNPIAEMAEFLSN